MRFKSNLTQSDSIWKDIMTKKTAKDEKKDELKINRSIHPTTSAKTMKRLGIKPVRNPVHGGSLYERS